MDEDEANDAEINAAKAALAKAEKDKQEEEAREAARKKEEEENKLAPDGLLHKPDGSKIYKPDNQVVGGVNSYNQVTEAPAAEPVVKTDTNVETLKEGEERAKDIEDAKNAFAKKAKAEADSAVSMQKTNEEAWASLPINEHDGLQHWPDGQK